MEPSPTSYHHWAVRCLVGLPGQLMGRVCGDSLNILLAAYVIYMAISNRLEVHTGLVGLSKVGPLPKLKGCRGVYGLRGPFNGLNRALGPHVIGR